RPGGEGAVVAPFGAEGDVHVHAERHTPTLARPSPREAPMKDVRQEFRYDHPVEAVYALISNGSFQLELIAHLGGRAAEIVSDEPAGEGKRLVTRQTTAVELPGFAKKIIPANSSVTQTYEWSAPDAAGSRSGKWSAEIKAAPIS